MRCTFVTTRGSKSTAEACDGEATSAYRLMEAVLLTPSEPPFWFRCARHSDKVVDGMILLSSEEFLVLEVLDP